MQSRVQARLPLVSLSVVWQPVCCPGESRSPPSFLRLGTSFSSQSTRSGVRHQENVRDKVKSRCIIISKLAVIDWGAPAPVLRTSAIALVYSVAEYCVPMWGRCAHVQHVDTQLNIAMRTVSGALRSTNINWLNANMCL